MTPLLSCEDLALEIAGTSILKGLRFSLDEGQRLAVVGPNGSGKSSLLKVLLRLHEKGGISGKISLAGRDLASFSQRKLARILSYVPQAGGLLPPFTLREVLEMSRYAWSDGPGISDRDQGCLDEALRLTSTEDLAHRRMDELSGGERQRGFLAAALAQDTPVLLLDEPASALDPRHAAELRRLLAFLNREQGKSLIVVTHDLHDLLESADRVLVLRQGEQIFFGSPQTMLEQGVLERAFEHGFSRLRHPQTGRLILLAD